MLGIGVRQVAVVWKGMMDACAANVIALPDVMESMEDVDSKSIFDLVPIPHPKAFFMISQSGDATADARSSCLHRRLICCN